MIEKLTVERLSQMVLLNRLDKDVRVIYEKYLTPSSKFMYINGQRVHYRIEGRGEPLLLLHGAFASLHTFDAWTNILKKHFRVIRLDMPGFGLSGPKIDDNYAMAVNCDFIATFLEILEIDCCHIAGSSLGGWTSWELCLRYPALFEKLVMLDPAGFIDSESIPLPFKMARTPFLNRVAKYTIRKTVLEVFMKQVFVDTSKVTEVLIDRYYDLNNLPGNAEAFVRMVNIKLIDNTHKLHRIEQPTLIIWGKQDRWLPLKNAYKFNIEIPKAELIIYDGAGHIPQEECPIISANDTIEFLKRGS